VNPDEILLYFFPSKEVKIKLWMRFLDFIYVNPIGYFSLKVFIC